MGAERNLWDDLREKVGPYGKLKRVENSCDKGTPDVSYLLRRYPSVPPVAGWLELKAGKVLREGTVVIDSLTLDQVLWQEDWAAGGGRVYTLARIGFEHVLMEPSLLRRVLARSVTGPTLIATARRWWPGPFQPHEVVKCLTET